MYIFTFILLIEKLIFFVCLIVIPGSFDDSKMDWADGSHGSIYSSDEYEESDYETTDASSEEGDGESAVNC